MTLSDYRLRHLETLRATAFPRSRYWDSVTLLAYAFPKDADDAIFEKIEFAILHSWRVLGKLKTVIVVHAPFQSARVFAARHDEIDLQVEPLLVPGDMDSMSADCDSRLAERFETDYCLLVQADGFPLQDRLSEFLGKWDFIGAPYVRLSWWRCAVCHILGYWMSNGGFSLRSRRLCRYAAIRWREKYVYGHPSCKTIDDLYYTKTLPLENPFFRFSYRIAPAHEALRFSYDALVPQNIKCLPFGFHRDCTFEQLSEALPKI